MPKLPDKVHIPKELRASIQKCANESGLKYSQFVIQGIVKNIKEAESKKESKNGD